MKLRYLVAFALVVFIGAGFVSQASAFSSGTVTNAFANGEWTKASFNVSVSPGVCVGSGYCSYHPVVIAQPNLPSYRCENGEFGDSDPNTQVAWFGPTLTTNAVYSSAVSEAPILNRVVGQRICVELVGENEYVSLICESQRKIIEEFTGKPSPACDPEKFFFQEYVSGALLSVAPVPPPASAPVAPTAAPATKPLVCPKGKRKVTRNGKKACIMIKHHHHHHHRAHKSQ
jgi:hypothetical protein